MTKVAMTLFKRPKCQIKKTSLSSLKPHSDIAKYITWIALPALLVICTVHTCSMFSKPVHTWHSNAGIDRPMDSPADGGKATLFWMRAAI